MTLLSRILGFLRDTVIARAFGAGTAMDAFIIAFRIPNLLRRLFAEGAFAQAFVPILAEYKHRRGDVETRLLVDHVSGLLAVTLFVITLKHVAVAPVIAYISAPGLAASPQTVALTVDLLRVTFPFIFFISLVSPASALFPTYTLFRV